MILSASLSKGEKKRKKGRPRSSPSRSGRRGRREQIPRGGEVLVLPFSQEGREKEAVLLCLQEGGRSKGGIPKKGAKAISFLSGRKKKKKGEKKKCPSTTIIALFPG